MSEQGPNGWPKSNLYKSALEIVFVTIFIPALVVGIIIFSEHDFRGDYHFLNYLPTQYP